MKKEEEKKKLKFFHGFGLNNYVIKKDISNFKAKREREIKVVICYSFCSLNKMNLNICMESCERREYKSPLLPFVPFQNSLKNFHPLLQVTINNIVKKIRDISKYL